jgi:hypothetical protein
MRFGWVKWILGETARQGKINLKKKVGWIFRGWAFHFLSKQSVENSL